MTLILVVEDEIEIRQDVCDVLEMEGYETICASDGEEGLKLIYEHRPNLILSDIRMSNMGGFEFLRRVRADDQLRTIPFIFVTAATSHEDREKADKLGATALIPKPFQLPQFLATIRSLTID